jgi:hypothetical protein
MIFIVIFLLIWQMRQEIMTFIQLRQETVDILGASQK